MDAYNNTRSRPRARTRSPQQFREASLAADSASEPRMAGPSACLYVRSGSEYLPASDDLILDCVRHWASERFRPGAPVLDCPRAVEVFLLSELVTREIEVVALILLDRTHRLICYLELSQGTRDSAPIPVRAVVRAALRHDATGAIRRVRTPSLDGILP